jgi:Tfp pilus assembly protein PilV
MQFIETHLGFSPDVGDGSIEILVAVVLVALFVLGATRLATR